MSQNSELLKLNLSNVSEGLAIKYQEVFSVACHTQQWMVGVVLYCLNNNSVVGLLFEIDFYFSLLIV